ncbi:hypothetical protein ACFWZT_28945 [Streptomyces alboflavus]|uniref:Secreted protein n=1 Tax=Streptomyces alboflavus TaxID=67267 RepID=A0A1Z1WAS9_9ACTN|nr:hypothetical protein [Streptomyces alboflavus]ARX83523.1 hypothetical protein SMD44_02945 [Streptomyces alboflavus]
MRRITAVAAMAVGTLALAGALAAPASAVPDPVATVDCAVQEVTGLVDVANPGVPAEVPATGCLAP